MPPRTGTGGFDSLVTGPYLIKEPGGDNARSVAVDSQGNVVLTGSVSYQAGSSSIPSLDFGCGPFSGSYGYNQGLALVAKSGFFATGEAMPGYIAPALALLWIVAVSVVIVRRDGVPPVARTEP